MKKKDATDAQTLESQELVEVEDLRGGESGSFKRAPAGARVPKADFKKTVKLRVRTPESSR